MARWMFALLGILTLMRIARMMLPHVQTKTTHAAGMPSKGHAQAPPGEHAVKTDGDHTSTTTR